MTNAQAFKAAQKRWGKTGAVKQTRPRPGQTIALPCSVGYVEMGMFFNVEGQGATWADAFKNADAKKIADAKRNQEIMKARGGK